MRPLSPILILILGVWLALAACKGGREPAPTLSEPRIVTFAELDAAVQNQLGSGTLISFWATW